MCQQLLCVAWPCLSSRGGHLQSKGPGNRAYEDAQCSLLKADARRVPVTATSWPSFCPDLVASFISYMAWGDGLGDIVAVL